MKSVKIGILGLGIVGSGTINVLSRNATEISRRAGKEIVVTDVCVRDLNRNRICDTSSLALTTDPFKIIRNPKIDIVIELIGGTTLALDFVLEAIENGKHVVTANKALIALHGNEIFAKANQKEVMVLFESAVAGGIPIIKAIREGLSGNKIEWLAGIINGTGNFILSEMYDKGHDFAKSLKHAQDLGYAESDSSFDVEGIDAGHKLAILASIAFGIPLQFQHVFTEGITKITHTDIEYAATLGYRIKHLGMARKTDLGIELRVHPALVPAKCLMANVDDVMNAVLVKGDAVGTTFYYGAGAGTEPTASAVVADIVDVVRMMSGNPKHRVPHLAFQPHAITNSPILSIQQINTAYYLRLNAKDQPGVLAEITKILATYKISIESLIQKKPIAGKDTLPIIILTHTTIEKYMNTAILEIEALTTIVGTINKIRLERLG